MHTEEYEAYLKSDEWRQLRTRKAIQMNYTCENCGKYVLYGFHIHHRTYKRLYHERLSDLQFLCAECHDELHRRKKRPLFFYVTKQRRTYPRRKKKG